MKTFIEFINEDIIQKLKEKLRNTSNEDERKIKVAEEGPYK